MSNINCDSCDYCNSCDCCYSCDYCNSCNSCDCCYSCNSCNSCSSCSSCNSCNSCNYCNSCINLKMTEYNYFCYANDKDNDGFQQPRYRVFNKQLTKDEYDKIEKVKMKLEFDNKEDFETRYKTAFKKAWDKLSQSDKDKITSLPGFNAEDFEKYYGVKIEEKKISIELTKEQLNKVMDILNLK